MSQARRLKVALWIFLGLIALYRAWIFRYDLVNDTVSYLDMGDQLFSGNVSALVNGTWGPLYAVLLGAWLHLFTPGPRWEYPAIHLLLTLIFFACLACFDFFLTELIAFKARREGRAVEGAPALTVVGYLIFAWASLSLVGVEETNPDMLVAAFFLLASGLVLRIHRGGAPAGAAIALGLAVGAGYLTKAVMLPIGALLIAAAASAGAGARGKLSLLLRAGLAAALLAAPQIAALSLQRGHFTTNETGRFNYAVHVQGVTYRHWQGEDEGAGRPLHPTRRLLADPAVFEFDGPLPGTYPFWFDPSYWYEGVQARISWRKQAQAIASNARGVLGLLFAVNGAPLAVFVLLLALSLRASGAFRSAAGFWVVLLPAAVALGPYVLVHYETRYLAGYLCVLMTAAIASVRLPAASDGKQLYRACAILVGAMYLVPFGPSGPASQLGLYQTLAYGLPKLTNTYWNVADALARAGAGPGSKVATLEYANMSSVLWARLARVKIVAEVYYRPDRAETNRNLFWTAPPEKQAQALEALRRAGAGLVVTAETPRGAGAERWTRLADSQYYYLSL